MRPDITAFSVFVSGVEQIILGFEVQYAHGAPTQLGPNDRFAVKLTLCLSLEGICSPAPRVEVVKSIRVAKADDSENLALEVSLVCCFIQSRIVY